MKGPEDRGLEVEEDDSLEGATVRNDKPTNNRTNHWKCGRNGHFSYITVPLTKSFSLKQVLHSLVTVKFLLESAPSLSPVSLPSLKSLLALAWPHGSHDGSLVSRLLSPVCTLRIIILKNSPIVWTLYLKASTGSPLPTKQSELPVCHATPLHWERSPTLQPQLLPLPNPTSLAQSLVTELPALSGTSHVLSHLCLWGVLSLAEDIIFSLLCLLLLQNSVRFLCPL